jgi:hypothetical protein
MSNNTAAINGLQYVGNAAIRPNPPTDFMETRWLVRIDHDHPWS